VRRSQPPPRHHPPESASIAFPHWLQVDLGSNRSVRSPVLDRPPAASWATRTQTLSVQGSADGSTYSTLVGSACHTFDPSTGNTVTVPPPSGSSARCLKLGFTANTGWPAGQLSELEVYAS
jgi:hypothetical protein